MKPNDHAIARDTVNVGVTVRHEKLLRRPDEQLVTMTFTLERRFLPATRAALQELRNLIAGRLENAGKYAWEDSIVNAQVGIGAIAAAVNKQCDKGDPNYAG